MGLGPLERRRELLLQAPTSGFVPRERQGASNSSTRRGIVVAHPADQLVEDVEAVDPEGQDRPAQGGPEAEDVVGLGPDRCHAAWTRSTAGIGGGPAPRTRWRRRGRRRCRGNRGGRWRGRRGGCRGLDRVGRSRLGVSSSAMSEPFVSTTRPQPTGTYPGVCVATRARCGTGSVVARRRGRACADRQTGQPPRARHGRPGTRRDGSSPRSGSRRPRTRRPCRCSEPVLVHEDRARAHQAWPPGRSITTACRERPVTAHRAEGPPDPPPGSQPSAPPKPLTRATASDGTGRSYRLTTTVPPILASTVLT